MNFIVQNTKNCTKKSWMHHFQNLLARCTQISYLLEQTVASLNLNLHYSKTSCNNQ